MKQKITDEQLKSCIAAGASMQEIAAQYNASVQTIMNRKSLLARQGYSPQHDMTHTVPDPFLANGISSYYNKDGILTAQWVKSRIDQNRQSELMTAAIAAMAEDIPPAAPVVFGGCVADDQLLNLYVITDFHLGMMAWGEETGDDWDLKIAEDMLYGWFDLAIQRSLPAKNCVFAQLGDFLHWDGMEAVTPRNRHVLDADTRFQKLVRVAIRAIRRIIQMLLTKHESVTLIQPGGNHDEASSLWLREIFHTLYENEPRVICNDTAGMYDCVEHGLTSLFFHHGHKRRPKNIDHVFAAKYRDVFGRTKFSYAHMGHLHHIDTRETSLMVVEQHRTLCSPDAFAAQGGYMAGRDANVITYHKKYGQVGRQTISADMIKSLQRNQEDAI